MPLKADEIKTIAVIGPNADSIPALEGNYNGTSSRYVTFLEGIRTWAETKGIRVLYSLGCHLYKDRTSGLAQADDRLAEAAMYAEAADVTIACVGLDATLEGEEGDTGNEFFSGDKKDLLIPESQRRLMAVLVKSAKKLVTVITGGSSLNVPEGNAKVFTWYPGQAGGTALIRLLSGEDNFSGHLPVTFYREIEDLPDFEDYNMSGRTYRYFTGDPLYPFGFGLTYTHFSVSNAAVHGETVEADVCNDGAMAGDAVLQVYVKADSPYAPLHPRLCAFGRISLDRGEKKHVILNLDKYARTVVNEDGERIPVSHMCYYIGFGQPDERSTALTGDKPLSVKE